MALTKSERATLKRLQAKSEETDDEDTPQRRSTDKPKRSNGHGGDDVVVLRGDRADAFLADLFGGSESDDDDDGEDEDEDEDPDDQPPPGPRWFR